MRKDSASWLEVSFDRNRREEGKKEGKKEGREDRRKEAKEEERKKRRKNSEFRIK